VTSQATLNSISGRSADHIRVLLWTFFHYFLSSFKWPSQKKMVKYPIFSLALLYHDGTAIEHVCKIIRKLNSKKCSTLPLLTRKPVEYLQAKAKLTVSKPFLIEKTRSMSFLALRCHVCNNIVTNPKRCDLLHLLLLSFFYPISHTAPLEVAHCDFFSRWLFARQRNAC